MTLKNWLGLFLRLAIAMVLVFFSIFFIWYSVFLSGHIYYRVDGASMVPTLNEEIPASKFRDAQGLSYDCVYVEKNCPANLFDIVVINTHQTITDKDGNRVNKTLIKRLMATAGDYVTIAKTVDELGNERLNLFRIPNGTIAPDQVQTYAIDDDMWKLDEKGENGYEIRMPDSLWSHQVRPSHDLTMSMEVEVNGQMFTHEYDFNFYATFLRPYGTPEQSFDYVVSTQGLVYVQVPEGQFFYLGDNRAFSSDSREDGFRDAENIVGPVGVIIYNNSFFKRIGTFMSYFFNEVEEFFAR